MNKQKIIILLLSFFSVQLIGQSYTEDSGLIVTLEKDTLRGVIKYLDGEKSPNEVEFQSTGTTKFYEAKDISSFEIPNTTIYKSRKLKYSTNPSKTAKLSYSKEVTYNEEQAFLEALVLGDMDLYEFRDDKKRRHLVIENADGELQDLIEIYYKAEGDKITKISKYKNQLKRLLIKCKTCYPQIDKTTLTRKSMTKLMNLYYETLGITPTYEAKTEKLIFELGLLAGVSMTNHFIDGTKAGDLSTNKNFELQLETIFPKYNKTWSVLTGISYREYLASTPLNILARKRQKLKYLKLSVALKKLLLNKDVKLHVNGGTTGSFALVDIINIRRYEQEVFLGIGFQKNKFLIDLRYAIGNGYSPFQNISTHTRTLYLLAGYKLSK